MNKSKFTLLIVALAALLLSACGAAGGASLTGGADAGGGGAVAGASGQLWADVPRMDGLDASNNQMPMMAEIFMQTMISQASEGAGSGDVAVFSTAHTVADIQAFYTNERMAASGWKTGDVTTCFSGADQGVADVGLFCAFAKDEGNAETVLVLIAAPDEQTGQNILFFVRLAGTATSTP